VIAPKRLRRHRDVRESRRGRRATSTVRPTRRRVPPANSTGNAHITPSTVVGATQSRRSRRAVAERAKDRDIVSDIVHRAWRNGHARAAGESFQETRGSVVYAVLRPAMLPTHRDSPRSGTSPMPRPILVLALLAVLPAVARAQSLTEPVAPAPAVHSAPQHAVTDLMLARQARRTARAVEARTLHQATAGELALADNATDLPRRADGFASSGFAQFMSSPAGRVLRVVAGAGMIAGGIAADSDGGTVLAGLGAVPLLAGTFDFCVLSPLFGGPFWGRDIRAAK